MTEATKILQSIIDDVSMHLFSQAERSLNRWDEPAYFGEEERMDPVGYLLYSRKGVYQSDGLGELSLRELLHEGLEIPEVHLPAALSLLESLINIHDDVMVDQWIDRIRLLAMECQLETPKIYPTQAIWAITKESWPTLDLQAWSG